MSNTRPNDDFDYSSVISEVMTPTVRESVEVSTKEHHAVTVAKKVAHPFLVVGAAGATIAATMLPFNLAKKSLKLGPVTLNKDNFFLSHYPDALLILSNSSRNSWLFLANQTGSIDMPDSVHNIIPQPYLMAAVTSPFIGFCDTSCNSYFGNRYLLTLAETQDNEGSFPIKPNVNYMFKLGTFGFSTLFATYTSNAFCFMGVRPFVASKIEDYAASNTLLGSLPSCAVAAAVQAVVTNPAMMIHKQRLVKANVTTLEGPSVRDAAKDLWNKEGVSGFYRGTGRNALNAFIIYGVLANVDFDSFFRVLLKLPMKQPASGKSPTLFQPASFLKIEELNSNAVADSSARPSRIEEPEDEPVSLRFANSMS